MSFKTEYITSLFQKTSSKKIESYCLTRLWHRLDNDQIKLVPQQYVNRHSDKYALTDVYLPQFKIHIEVNEPAHYLYSERILADEIRKSEIESKTGHKLFTIDCSKELAEIHKQIDNIIAEVNLVIYDQKTKGLFKPWQPDIENNPNYWKQKKTITTDNEISLNNIEDICALFDADFNKTKRGYLRGGGLEHPKKLNYFIWWPSENTRQGWVNELSEDELTITETNKDDLKRVNHFKKYLNTEQIRIVFFHNKDVLGFTSYKFKGIYSYDVEQSKPEIGTVWKKIGEKFNL